MELVEEHESLKDVGSEYESYDFVSDEDEALEDDAADDLYSAISVKEGLSMRGSQLKALGYKFFILGAKREYGSTLLRLLVPALVVLFLCCGIVVLPAYSARFGSTPKASPIGGIPNCNDYDNVNGCVTLLYNVGATLEYNTTMHSSWSTVDSTDWSSWYAEDERDGRMKASEKASDVRTMTTDCDSHFLGSVLGNSPLFDFGCQHDIRPDSRTYEQLRHEKNIEAQRKAAEKKHQKLLRETAAERHSASVAYADAIMGILCETNAAGKLELGKDVVRVDAIDAQLISDLRFQRYNYTYGVVEFLDSADFETEINYRIIYNSSYSRHYTMTGSETRSFNNNYRQDLEAAVERSIWIYWNNPSNPSATENLKRPVIEVGAKDYPTVPSVEVSLVMWMLSISVLLVALGVNYFYAQVILSRDKELGYRGQMKLAGLRDSAYWCSVVVEQALFSFISVALMVALGWLFPYFYMFGHANIFCLFLIFFTFQMLFCSIACLTSVLVKKRKTAIILASLHFGLFLILTFAFSTAFIYILEPFEVGFGWAMLFLLPPYAYTVLLSEVLALTVPGYAREACIPHSGLHYTFVEFFTYSGCRWMRWIQPPVVLLLPTIFQVILFYFLAYFLDKIVKDDNKASLGLFFFLRPSYWRMTKPSVEEVGSAALRIEHLTKTYKSGLFSTEGTTAVKPFQLDVPSNSVFALLGSNGAGKTTVINCLTGLVTPSEGDAFVHGYSVRNNMDSIRSMMGVCPQFDMLFDNLTAWEHMHIINAMKRPLHRMTNDELVQRLEDVRLADVMNQKTSTFSGGMKRRLSVVLATIGRPRVLFLDEPSTGMDPANRRFVWSLIRKIKKSMLIILTTHAMDEADSIGDNVAIMAAGKLRCSGTPLSLKQRFGIGYRVTLTCDSDKTEEVKRLVQRRLPGAQLRGDNAGALVYGLPNVDANNDAALFFEEITQAMDENEQPLIQDWGCQNSTMEDVFLGVTRKVLGQDITFDSDTKRAKLDRDEREIFRDASGRFERRILFLNEEVAALREALHRFSPEEAQAIATAIDREDQALSARQ